MEYKISILQIIHDTIVDGEGFRTSIYCAGCPHHCENCHNQNSWDMKNGMWKSINEIYDKVISNTLTNVTFTGGDPMYQAEAFYHLAKRIKETTEKSIWCYTGFTFEELNGEWQQKLLKHIDVLVDGKYHDSLRDPLLRFKGSSNQRIIDVQNSMIKNQIILWKSKGENE